MIIQISPDFLPFNLDYTLDCGQTFRWYKDGSDWIGVIKRNKVTLRQNGNSLFYEGIEREELIRYLNLHQDLGYIISSIRNSIYRKTGGQGDPFFETALQTGEGLRIIRQDPWESLISFICSQNSNIPVIKRRISLLCLRYGTPICSELYTFPTPENLAFADHEELQCCSTGYRTRYLSETSRFILSNPDFLVRLEKMTYYEAWTSLQSLPGVGPKVADCVLLFAYNFYQAVPVDVWIRSIITRRYPEALNLCGRKKNCSYQDISQFCRDYFGDYAGYAQQLLFASRLDQPGL